MELDDILDERQAMYGDAAENFRRIAAIWSQLLDITIDPLQVPQLFIAAKLVRISANPDYQDSWLDIQGYAKHGLDTI
jgi:hypothetical protein